jgi:hypothetical protein
VHKVRELIAEYICAVIYALVVIARRRTGRSLRLFSLASPPRVEIFYWILLTPSAIFTTQAAAPGHPAVATLGAWCLAFAALLFLWATLWVIVWKLLICKTIVFVVIPRRSRVSFFGAASKPSFVAPGTAAQADHPASSPGGEQSYSQVGARRRSSRAGFVIDAEHLTSMPAGWCASCSLRILLVH